MNIIIPLGGLGSRFQNEGYSRPKPFVRVLGKEMIKWVIDNLTLGPDDSLVIVYNPSFMSMDVFMQEEVQNKYKNTTLVELAGPTRGAAETVLLGLQGIPEAQRKRPCMLCDGDTFYTADIVSRYREVSTTHNGTFCFSDTQPKPIYSYVTVNSADEVQDIKEKVKISDYANTGCYCFKNGCELETYCEKIIEAGAMQLSQDQKGEFYTSGVIKAMLDDGLPCKMLQLERTDLHVLGTPSQVEEFCAAWPEQPCLRFVFDLDNTLCTGPKVSGDYSTTEPIPRDDGIYVPGAKFTLTGNVWIFQGRDGAPRPSPGLPNATMLAPLREYLKNILRGRARWGLEHRLTEKCTGALQALLTVLLTATFR